MNIIFIINTLYIKNKTVFYEICELVIKKLKSVRIQFTHKINTLLSNSQKMKLNTRLDTMEIVENLCTCKTTILQYLVCVAAET